MVLMVHIFAVVIVGRGVLVLGVAIAPVSLPPPVLLRVSVLAGVAAAVAGLFADLESVAAGIPVPQFNGDAFMMLLFFCGGRGRFLQKKKKKKSE